MTKSKPDFKNQADPTDVSRRRLLTGVAAMGGSLALAAAATPSATAAKPAKASPHIIIVGGGFAGCVSARELAQRGYKVTLLEAQGRLGGRAYTWEFAGKKVEMGAVMVSWNEPFMWSEITRYGLEIEPIVGALSPERCYWITGGTTKSATLEEFSKIFIPPVEGFFADASEVFPYPYDPLFNKAAVEKLDKLSVLDRVKTMPTQEGRDLADNWASAPLGRDGAQVGLAATLALCSAFGGVEEGLKGTSYRIKDGTTALIHKIVEDGGYEVRMGSPVSAISQSKTGVKVTIEGGETLEAAAVILAAPVNTYDGISFTPPLNAGKQAVSKGNMAGGQGVHINARLKGKIPPFFAISPSDMPLHLLLTTDILDDSVIVDGYGPDATILNGNNAAEVQKAIRNWLPDAEVMETIAYDWTVDPYAQGTWCGFGPGVLSKYYDALRVPEGNVYFASGDSASGFRGFMEGAIESGVRVARDVHNSFSSTKAHKA